MHLKKFLCNNIKASHVLLKFKEGNWIQKLMDMDKTRTKVKPKSEPKMYHALQTEKCNKRYPHLTYQLRNVFGGKTSFASDVYSLGYILSIYPLKYHCIKF